MKSYIVCLLSVACLLGIQGNSSHAAAVHSDKGPELKRLFPKQQTEGMGFEGNITASPLLDLSQGKAKVLIALSGGEIVAQDARTGEQVWRVKMPAPAQHAIVLVATPVRVQNKLVVAYQTTFKHKRHSHWVAIVDLSSGSLDKQYPPVELKASQSMADRSARVAFNPATAFSHSDLVHARKAGSKMGYVYVSFGNSADIQPFHGWLFELDLDRWLAKGAAQAVSASLLTTPEIHCPEAGKTGSRDMICGGGIWAPAGPQVVQGANDYELIVPVGNGQFDLKRKDYAGTLMRLRQGLVFDPGCDAQLCEHFDVTRDPQPEDLACMNSCRNLFIPRLQPGAAPLRPASGGCDGKSFWQCMMWSDYDLGANAPAPVTLSNGLSVWVQPGKEGGLYLLDAQRLGVQYDRQQMVPLCGTKQDPCQRDWAGMVVTQPAVTEVAGVPVVIVATFMPDRTHAAGLLAYKIVLTGDGRPRLQRFWQAPDPDTAEAMIRFRSHPSRVVLAPWGDSSEMYAWVAIVAKPGMLWGVRVRDGAVVSRTHLIGTGRPLSRPLVYKGVIYEPVNTPDRRRSWLEAYEMK